MQPRYLGIEIGGTKLQIVVGDASAAILQRYRFAVNRNEGGSGIRREIEKCVREILKATSVTAIGVGYGGPVDYRTGKICCSHHVEGWNDFPLGPWLAKISGVPTIVDNDANTACLGEALHGAGSGFEPVFYITMGSGVGGGLVCGGKVFHGAKPGEVEIGHVRVDRSGEILESRCSGWAVDGKVRAAILKNPGSALAKFAGPGPSGQAKALVPALAAGDAIAQEILDETAGDLAFGLSHVVHLLHPEVVILGGGLSLVGEPLRQAVESALPKWIMKAFLPGPKIVLAGLREDAVPVGALALAASFSK